MADKPKAARALERKSRPLLGLNDIAEEAGVDAVRRLFRSNG